MRTQKRLACRSSPTGGRTSGDTANKINGLLCKLSIKAAFHDFHGASRYHRPAALYRRDCGVLAAGCPGAGQSRPGPPVSGVREQLQQVLMNMLRMSGRRLLNRKYSDCRRAIEWRGYYQMIWDSESRRPCGTACFSLLRSGFPCAQNSGVLPSPNGGVYGEIEGGAKLVILTEEDGRGASRAVWLRIRPDLL